MTTTFTEGVQASLAPWADPAGNWQAGNQALAACFEEVYGIVADQGSPDVPASFTAGWSTLLDPTACPAQFLAFCGAFIGVPIPPGADPVAARAQIIAEANFSRGQGFAGSYTTSTIPEPGIVGAAQRFLTGTQSVTLIERVEYDGTTPDPYHFVLIVLTSEVLDVMQLTAAVNATKPGGIQWTLIQTSAWTITELEASAYTPISTTESMFPKISNLETDVI